MSKNYRCDRCSEGFGTPNALRSHLYSGSCWRTSGRTERMKAASDAAAASRKEQGIPDWTNGLLKPWKGEAA